MVRLVSDVKCEPINYSNIPEYLKSKLKQSKRSDGRSFLDYRKPNFTIFNLEHPNNSLCGILLSAATITAGSNSLNVRIFASANYSSQKSPVITTVEFNKLDEDEIADIAGHNLNYGFWIGTMIDNIITTLIGEQLEQHLPFEEKIITCYWSLNVVINFDSYDGNGLDWSVFATNIALKNIKFPIISLNSEGKFITHQHQCGSKIELKLPAMTFCITYCKIGDCEIGRAHV